MNVQMICCGVPAIDMTTQESEPTWLCSVCDREIHASDMKPEQVEHARPAGRRKLSEAVHRLAEWIG